MARLNSRQWQIINRKRTRFFRKYSRAFAIALGKQIKRVEKAIEIDFNSVIEKIPDLVNDQEITPVFGELYKEAGGWFAVDTLKGFQKQDETELLSIFEQQMEAFGLNVAAENVRQITSTTVEEAKRILRPIIAEAIDEGFGVDKTAANILERFSKEYKSNEIWRAKRIAQTELIGASNQGAFKAAQSVDFPVVKTWLAGGPNVRDDHAAAGTDPKNAGIKLEDSFIVGGELAMHPGDPSLSPAQLINCMCAISTRPER